jgi:putative transposase
MLKAIKIKLYLNDEQKVYCNKLLGSCRFVYNKMLEYKIQKYNEDKSSVGFGELGVYLTSSLKNEHSWLKESHSKVLQQSLINLDNAYKNFFKRSSVGFPKFKSKNNHSDSARFPLDAIGRINGNRINIIKPLKNILFKCSPKDEIYLNKNQNLIKSATLSKTKSGDYIFSILIDGDLKKQLPKPTNHIIGIDLGIKDFIVDSNGIKYENIKTIRNNEKKLIKLQRNHSKKEMVGTGLFKYNEKWKKDVEIKQPSKNREKSRIKLAKYHNKLKNQKEYYLHNVANQLLNNNQVIVIEDLNVNGMMKNHNLAKSIQELSLYRFKEILMYKAEWYGKVVHKVDRFYASSKTCSCGVT